MRTQKLCSECGTEPVSGRRLRCPSCKKAAHARSMRGRRAAESGRDGWDANDTAIGQQMLLYYTVPGAASEPPSFDIHQPRKREARGEDEISDGRVPSPQERWEEAQHRRTIPANIPASVWHDRVRLERIIVGQSLGPGGDDELLAEMSSWDALQARNERLSNTVSFHIPAPGSPALCPKPQPRHNSLGQSIPRGHRPLR